MKKFFVPVLAVAMMSLFAACSGVEDKADTFVKDEMEALSSLDFNKAQEVAKEAEEYREGLSEDDKAKFDEAINKAAEKYKEEFDKKAEEVGKSVEGAMDGLNDLNKSVDDIMNDDGSDSDE